MRLVIISGRSGSGKSTALDVLEDSGFYCIDNLPVSLLPALVEQTHDEDKLSKVAVSIDARNVPSALNDIQDIIAYLRSQNCYVEIIFLDANSNILLQRFSATRRRHPLTTDTVSLSEAIDLENDILAPLATMAHLTIDTTSMSVHDLRHLIRLRVAKNDQYSMAILFESFGYKHGIPVDADYVFDVRNLPNPFWQEALRSYNGTEQPIIDYLQDKPEVQNMQADISKFLHHWIPEFIKASRSYFTVAIGCTGGQHRSVFLVERLAQEFAQKFDNVQIRHRQLTKS